MWKSLISSGGNIGDEDLALNMLNKVFYMSAEQSKHIPLWNKNMKRTKTNNQKVKLLFPLELLPFRVHIEFLVGKYRCFVFQ